MYASSHETYHIERHPSAPVCANRETKESTSSTKNASFPVVVAPDMYVSCPTVIRHEACQRHQARRRVRAKEPASALLHPHSVHDVADGVVKTSRKAETGGSVVKLGEVAVPTRQTAEGAEGMEVQVGEAAIPRQTAAAADVLAAREDEAAAGSRAGIGAVQFEMSVSE